MTRRAMKESLTDNLRDQLDKQRISEDLHAKATKVVSGLSAADWKDIDNMSAHAATDMVLEIARQKEGA